jgi:hypothetical protein
MTMSDFDWKGTLKKLAPTAAALLAGPFAGMAVKALGDALSIDEPTQEKIAQAFQSQQLTGEQLVAVKTAEQALALKLEELGVKRDELDVENTKSARDMQIATRSWVPGALAFLITGGFFGILGWMLSDASIKPSEALLIMLGALATAWGSVVNYFFGSSQGSRDKTNLIDRMSK